MDNIQIDKMWKVLMTTSAISVIVGSIFKIQHYPYGDVLLYSGIAGWFLFLGIKTIYKKRQQKI